LVLPLLNGSLNEYAFRLILNLLPAALPGLWVGWTCAKEKFPRPHTEVTVAKDRKKNLLSIVFIKN
jgi:hypothetical protein